ncbi:WGR domain-containing protein [Pannonibacter phragmitetus]|uniref:WGR domain-containing protein n=1 Tax=Pannonibacter phragmitetus TaxID=121719 RepID=UPI001FFC76F6|nr:WGR domain-containing protein [Pannonibacter phragmitetus]
MDSKKELDAASKGSETPGMEKEQAGPDHLRGVVLDRVDRDRNMARFYRISVDPALFGLMAVTREWGRIGRSGQSRIDLYPNVAEAAAAASVLMRNKMRRGYVPAGGRAKSRPKA